MNRYAEAPLFVTVSRAIAEYATSSIVISAEVASVVPEKVADPLRDEALSEVARGCAINLLERDPDLRRPEHAGMQETLRRQYGRAMELFRVG